MPGTTPSPANKRTASQWRKLPAVGREGEPPAFPLGRISKGVAALWAQLWSSPQAVAWEELGWTRVVARYAKKLVEAEKANAPVSLQAEVRQLEDRLGLSPLAMRKNYWMIDDKTSADADDGDRPDNVTDLEEYRELYGAD